MSKPSIKAHVFGRIGMRSVYVSKKGVMDGNSTETTTVEANDGTVEFNAYSLNFLGAVGIVGCVVMMLGVGTLWFFDASGTGLFSTLQMKAVAIVLFPCLLGLMGLLIKGIGRSETIRIDKSRVKSLTSKGRFVMPRPGMVHVLALLSNGRMVFYVPEAEAESLHDFLSAATGKPVS